MYDIALGLVFRQLAGGMEPARLAAAAAAIVLLRAVRRPVHRTEILLRLLRDFACSRSCLRRMTFLDVCDAALRRCSKRCALSATCSIKLPLVTLQHVVCPKSRNKH